MHFALPAIVNLNGVDYTDESRQPIEIAWDERSTKVTLASGKIKKYIRYKGRNFTITWTMMPQNSSHSIDVKAGREELVNLVNGQDELTLTLTDGISSPATYTCLITDYTESIVMRRNSFIIWSCKLTLEEVGG